MEHEFEYAPLGDTYQPYQSAASADLTLFARVLPPCLTRLDAPRSAPE